MFVTVLFVANNPPEVTLVVAINVDVLTLLEPILPVKTRLLADIPCANKLPVDTTNPPSVDVVPTMFVTVLFVANNPPEVTLVVNLAVPFTSSVVLGAIVFIPTFPPVVKIFPIVLELNVDVIPPVTKILPVVIPIENIAVVPPPPPPPPTNKTPF